MATYTSHYNLTKPEGTERVNIAIINQNMDAIDTQMYKNAQSIIANHGGMAIPSNNNTHAAVSSGQYVYVYNHSSLAEGLYVATSAISTNGALSLSNLTAVSNGGLNHVYNTLNSNLEKKVEVLDVGTFSSAADVVNYFKQLATNDAYRNRPLFRYIHISSPGEPLLFGTSSFIVLATLSSSTYGNLLCLSDNRASGGVKNICIAGNRAFVEEFTKTETEITLS